jgi:hypothetical protein
MGVVGVQSEEFADRPLGIGKEKHTSFFTLSQDVFLGLLSQKYSHFPLLSR